MLGFFINALTGCCRDVIIIQIYFSLSIMGHQFKLNEICDQNINLLIGSGASYGLFPTLTLDIKSNDGSPVTVETLASSLGDRSNDQYTALFMHYYKSCIEPVLLADYGAVVDEPKRIVLRNYEIFLQTLVTLLTRKKIGERRSCNLFTTNYDGCLAYAAENHWKNGNLEFQMNDGTMGFQRRYLDAKNFSTVLTQTGAFGTHQNEVPQINLIHLHGSSYWHKDEHRIIVDYARENAPRLVKSKGFDKCAEFTATLSNKDASLADLPNVKFTAKELTDFWDAYDALPIVNPTKWKFYETVFEEHYYQMLRYLSYELEKPHSVLLTFGYSFADEHIRQLLKRSISNPSLQIFICCFDQSATEYAKNLFGKFPNVELVNLDHLMTFTVFNEEVFSMTRQVKPAAAPPVEGNEE